MPLYRPRVASVLLLWCLCCTAAQYWKYYSTGSTAVLEVLEVLQYLRGTSSAQCRTLTRVTRVTRVLLFCHVSLITESLPVRLLPLTGVLMTCKPGLKQQIFTVKWGK